MLPTREPLVHHAGGAADAEVEHAHARKKAEEQARIAAEQEQAARKEADSVQHSDAGGDSGL